MSNKLAGKIPTEYNLTVSDEFSFINYSRCHDPFLELSIEETLVVEPAKMTPRKNKEVVDGAFPIIIKDYPLNPEKYHKEHLDTKYAFGVRMNKTKKQNKWRYESY